MSTPEVPIRRIKEESIITGEAVTLDIHPASPLLRVGAATVDVACSGLGILLIAIVAAQVLEAPSASLARVYSIGAIVMTTIVVPLIVEVLTRGRSLGKWAFGLQVVRDDGGLVTVRHSLVRMAAGVLEVWLTLGGVAFITALVAPRSKRLGDLAAGTMVIHLPEPRIYPPLLMPPDLAQWASTAQVLPLPDALSSQALFFLRHNASLRADIRLQGAVELAQKVARYVSPEPREVHPERFLAAVLVINRDKAYRHYTSRQEQVELNYERTSSIPFELGERNTSSAL